ncbi:MAG TPA: hypothetical protein VIJ55_13950 [Acetobacteraceae bacterium]
MLVTQRDRIMPAWLTVGGASTCATIDGLSPRHVERMIDQRLDALQEPERVREFRMDLECRLARPARVDVEQPRIADRTIGPDRHTASLLAGRADDIAQRRRNGILLPLSGMEAGEYEQFRRALLLWLPLAKLKF